MNNIRPWKILCWNIRGINSNKKWNSIRDKIVESKCNILCLQETKRHLFTNPTSRTFIPKVSMISTSFPQMVPLEEF